MAGDIRDILILVHFTRDVKSLPDDDPDDDKDENDDNIFLFSVDDRRAIAKDARNLVTVFDNCEKVHRRANSLSGDKAPPIVSIAIFSLLCHHVN